MTTWLQKTMFSGNYFSSSSDNYCKKRFITSVLKKKLCLTNLCYFWLRIKKSRNVQCNNSVIYGHLWPYLVWLIHQNCFKISFLYNQEEEFQKLFLLPICDFWDVCDIKNVICQILLQYYMVSTHFSKKHNVWKVLKMSHFM